MSESFTITNEQCEQLNKEYVINDCLYYLMKTKEFIGGTWTIDDAIDELKKKTRFADEVMDVYKKSRPTLASDYLA